MALITTAPMTDDQRELLIRWLRAEAHKLEAELPIGNWDVFDAMKALRAAQKEAGLALEEDMAGWRWCVGEPGHLWHRTRSTLTTSLPATAGDITYQLCAGHSK